MNKFFITLALWLFTGFAFAGTTQVKAVRVWQAPDHTRLVFDIDQPVKYKVFSLDNPERIVIDLANSIAKSSLQTKDIKSRDLQGMRHAMRAKKDLRIVLDLQHQVRPKTFLLKPNQSYGHRLVIDLYNSQVVTKVAKSIQDLQKGRDVIIAIDAGHGGEDPGAIGSVKGTYEKHVVLQIAKYVKQMVDEQHGMRGVLTRTGDYYVGLRKRIQMARQYKADLFVSIHADAFRDKSVRGSSVYVLSRRGASSEAARWLAEKENAVDLVGGVSLDDKDDTLASVLLDLSQSATQEASLFAAQRVYQQLDQVGKVHGRYVHQAGFLVLKSPDIPSLLVETGFISNPQEERQLRDPTHQKKVARAITQGIYQYFQDAPPPGTILAKR